MRGPGPQLGTQSEESGGLVSVVVSVELVVPVLLVVESVELVVVVVVVVVVRFG